MAKWGANHGAISYGHIGGDLITLASMLRIPVCMHNVRKKEFPTFSLNALVPVRKVVITVPALYMGLFINNFCNETYENKPAKLFVTVA
jgi:hypothetical protein